jgi:predicted metal-dependent enzyme (double-stranded beta helix superfamily)
MNVLATLLTTLSAVVLAWGPVSARAAAQTSGDHPPTYAKLSGEVLLDNERVLVQKFIIRPGQSSGIHRHHGPELLVVIKGGVLVSQSTGRATLWKDGGVFWPADDPDGTDEGSRNIGTTTIELIWVTLKPTKSSEKATTTAAQNLYLNYPNLPGEDLLENDWVIVQRFVLNPRQWEGVHAHHPNMLYIFVKGGQWVSRSYRQARTASGDSPDGSVGWMPTIDISEGHESGNIGKHPSEVVWISLKK